MKSLRKFKHIFIAIFALSIVPIHAVDPLFSQCFKQLVSQQGLVSPANLMQLRDNPNFRFILIPEELKQPLAQEIIKSYGPNENSVPLQNWLISLSTLTHRTLTGHTSYVNSAAFSPDGTKIVTASSDHTAKIWDLPSFNGLSLEKVLFLSLVYCMNLNNQLLTIDNKHAHLNVYYQSLPEHIQSLIARHIANSYTTQIRNFFSHRQLQLTGFVGVAAVLGIIGYKWFKK